MNYFIIPGNPPAVHFYQLWKNEIETLNNSKRVQVAVYPLIKNTTHEQFFDQTLASLQQQFLNFNNSTSGPVWVLGHSLGGYFSLRLLQESFPLIDKTILLHPFLKMPKKRGRAILKTVSLFQRSERIQDVIVKNRKLLEYFSDELPYVSNEELYKTFQIAKHESQTIARDGGMLNIDPKLREKLHVFYHHNDTWCPQKVIQCLRKQISSSECSEPHSFITNKNFRESLYKKIMSLEE